MNHEQATEKGVPVSVKQAQGYIHPTGLYMQAVNVLTKVILRKSKGYSLDLHDSVKNNEF